VAVKKEFEEEQRKAGKLTKIPQLRKLPDYWSPYNYANTILPLKSIPACPPNASRKLPMD